METDTVVADTILQQMGGHNRLRAMIGARFFVARPDGVTFKWPCRQWNCVQVDLGGDDLYTMSFYKIGHTATPPKAGPVFDGLYHDMLIERFEHTTGLRLSL